MTMDGTNLSIVTLLTCEDIEILLSSIGNSDNETKNSTHEAFIQRMGLSHCIPVPYPGVFGARKWIVSIILIIFLLFGLIGNLLSAKIMYGRSRRGLSSYFYLALLAVLDICVLYTGCLPSLLEILFYYTLQIQSTNHCRFLFYFQHLFTYISAWLIVAVTFERFIVVRFPFLSIRICRMHVAYGITITIFTFFIIFTAHCFKTMNVTYINIQTDVGYHPNHPVCDSVIHKQLLANIDLFLYSIIPSILILLFNVLIISTIFYAIKQRQTYLQASSCLATTDTCPRNMNKKNKSSSSIRTPFFRSRSLESTPVGRSIPYSNRLHANKINKNGSQGKSHKVLFDSTSATGLRLTCLLLIISFIFVLCTLPISIRSLFSGFTSAPISTSHLQITYLSLTVLMYLNHTINFVIYCLTGRAFRHECQQILCGIWALKAIEISCTRNPSLYEYNECHPHFILADRNRLTNQHNQQQQEQRRMKRSHI